MNTYAARGWGHVSAAWVGRLVTSLNGRSKHPEHSLTGKSAVAEKGEGRMLTPLLPVP